MTGESRLFMDIVGNAGYPWHAQTRRGLPVKFFQLMAATAAVAWPALVTAQDGSGIGGGLLGGAVDKGAVSAAEKAPVELAGPATAGSDPKTAEPGNVAFPEPEVAEVPATRDTVAPATGEDPVAEAAAGAQPAPLGPPAPSGLADMVRETADAAPDPAGPPPVPLVEIEVGADPAQVAVDLPPDTDMVIATADLGAGAASDEDAPGEEFVRLTREETSALPRPTRPELLEALASATLTPPSTLELAGGELGPDALVRAALPGEREEPRESDLAALIRMTGGGNAVLEAAAQREFVAPNLAFADVTEEVVTREEEAVLAALAADPQAPFEEKSMTDPNQIVCLEALGEPFAGVPANDTAKAEARARLVEAAPACVAASEGPRAAPEVLFFAGEVALARGDFPGAFALYERAAAEGVAAANTRLADFYVYGAPPVTADSAQAAARLEAGAAAGDPQARTVLALMYGEGSSVPQNSARMIELLTEAANDGYHFAEYRRAKAYLDGEGVPGRADPALGIPDPAQAVTWFTRAADAGNLDAALELAGLYADPNSGLPENPAEQLRLTQMAVDAGLPSAIAALGVLYETGRGVERQPARAAALYIQALETGKVPFEDLRKGAPFDWEYDTAVAFQDALSARGVYNGGSDGIVGAGTRAAAEQLIGG